MSFFKNIIAKYRSSRKSFQKYLKAVSMMLSDAYQLDKKRTILVLITSGGGVSMLGMSLGLLLKYVRQLEKDITLNYLGYSIHARDGFFLAVISVSIMVLLGLSAALLHYSRLKTRDIMVDYHLASLPRVAKKYGWTPPDKIAWIDDTTLQSNVRTLYMNDSQKTTMAMRRIFEGFQHFLTTFGGIGLLLWLDLEATLYLMLIIGLSFGFYIKITRRASKATRKYENLSGEASRKSRALLNDVGTWPNPDYNPVVLRGITHGGFLKDNLYLYFDRYVTRSQTEFFSYILTAVALCFLVMTLGYAAIEGRKSWASIVGFILILRTVMQTMKNMLKIFTEVTRLYPSISRIYKFNPKSAPKSQPGKTINKLNLPVSDEAVTERSLKQISVQPGEIIGISAPVTLSRYSITFFDQILSGNIKKRKNYRPEFIESISIAVPLSIPQITVTLRELIGIPENTGTDELRIAAGSLAKKIERTFPLEPEQPITQKDLNKLSQDSLNRLSLISCLLSDRPIILAQRSLITEDWLNENKAVLKEKILAVCYTGLPGIPVSVQTPVKTYIAAASDGIIVAAGSFGMMQKRKTAVNKMLQEHTRQLISNSEKLVVVAGVEDDDDE
jgi:hypothetical protein